MALHHEAVGTANALGVVHVDLAVGEYRPLDAAEGYTEDLGDLLSQRLVRRPCEHHEPLPARKLHQLSSS